MEAHISGKAAGEHAGRLGREFRDQLESAAEAVEDDLGTEDGIPMERVLGALAVLVLLYLLTRGGGTDDGEGDGEEPAATSEEEDAIEGGGLVG